MNQVEPGQLWEWKNGAFTGTRFLVMEVNHHPADPKREDWSSVEIQEFVGGGIKPRTITMTALRMGARTL
jgi:hypothetical protein